MQGLISQSSTNSIDKMLNGFGVPKTKKQETLFSGRHNNNIEQTSIQIRTFDFDEEKGQGNTRLPTATGKTLITFNSQNTKIENIANIGIAKNSDFL